MESVSANELESRGGSALFGSIATVFLKALMASQAFPLVTNQSMFYNIMGGIRDAKGRIK
jgi:hypothetical protein